MVQRTEQQAKQSRVEVIPALEEVEPKTQGTIEATVNL